MTIEERLTQLYPDGQWAIQKAHSGESSQAFIASNGKKKVFIKYDVTSRALKRLAELGLTPKLIYDGTHEDRPYIVQEFVAAEYPDRKWFSGNLQPLAKFITAYQQDVQLRNILLGNRSEEYSEHIERELRVLEESINNSGSDVFNRDEVKTGIKRLQEKSKSLKRAPLVPTHADPNAKNFLITNNGLVMVDWDDIKISDPMKDVGLMLWWYVPKIKWGNFAVYYGRDLDEEKIYWWTARASIQIATWFAKRNDKENAEFFLREFLGALQERDNSQMYMNDPNV